MRRCYSRLTSTCAAQRRPGSTARSGLRKGRLGVSVCVCALACSEGTPGFFKREWKLKDFNLLGSVKIMANRKHLQADLGVPPNSEKKWS